jgi:anti-sigma-K factor RskA
MINKYLLGDLPEQEQVAIEEAAFQDEQQRQAIQDAENDLIDEYVRGELSEHDRRLFETRFLVSAERRRKIQFAKALAKLAPEFATKETAPALRRAIDWREGLKAFIYGLSPVPRFALAAATLLVLLGGAWLVFETLRLRSQLLTAQASREKQEQSLQQQIASERTRIEQLTTVLRNEQQQREQTEQLLKQVEEAQEAKVESQPTIVTLALLSGIPRGGGAAQPKLQLQPGTRLVRLQLEVDPADEYKSFRVELSDRAGVQVWSRAGLSARSQRGGKSLMVTLPANILKQQQYEVLLKGISNEGATEDLAYYYFDVLKK